MWSSGFHDALETERISIFGFYYVKDVRVKWPEGLCTPEDFQWNEDFDNKAYDVKSRKSVVVF